MADNFESYLKQLQEIEQSDNRATLYTFCSLNEPVLSYFKGIWGPLQNILQSSQVDTGIIKDIRPALVHLSDIKDRFESIRSNIASDCHDEVLQFQKQIDAITVYSYGGVDSRLKELEEKNRQGLLKDARNKKKAESGRSTKTSTGASTWDEVKDRILKGQMSSSEDIALAEEHIAEGATLSFFKSLASKTRKTDVLDNVYIYAQKALGTGQWVDLLWTLVRTGIPFDKKEAALLDLIDRTDDPNALTELGNYCDTERSRSFFNRKYKSVVKQSGGGSNASKVLTVIGIIIICLSLFYRYFL